MGPQRIVCLTEETTEWLYLLGQEQRIVGISGYTVRPRQARQEKPRVSAFLDGNVDKIVALQPDLVIGFSDMQAALADKLIRVGLNVFITNQRSVAQIFDTLRLVAGLVGAQEHAQTWIAQCQQRHAHIAAVAATWARRPRVYFEEWDDPMISAIQWVSELITVAGGDDDGHVPDERPRGEHPRVSQRHRHRERHDHQRCDQIARDVSAMRRCSHVGPTAAIDAATVGRPTRVCHAATNSSSERAATARRVAPRASLVVTSTLVMVGSEIAWLARHVAP